MSEIRFEYRAWDILMDLHVSGWCWQVRREKDYDVVLWKEEWITDNLYSATRCPHGKGETLADALDEALRDRTQLWGES